MLGSLGGGWRDHSDDAEAAAEGTPYVVKLSSWNILGADALFRAAVGGGGADALFRAAVGGGGADALFRAAVGGGGAGHVGGTKHDHPGNVDTTSGTNGARDSGGGGSGGSGGGVGGGDGGGGMINTPEAVTAIREVPWVFIYRDPVEVRSR